MRSSHAVDASVQCTYDRSNFSGLVRLQYFGELKCNWKQKVYKPNRNINPYIYGRIDRNLLLDTYVDPMYGQLENNTLPNVFCGPGIKYRYAIRTRDDPDFGTGIDAVVSVFCHQWPKDAHSWFIRPRNNGCPTSDTISEVVRNGCHVVYVQHRACRDEAYQ